VKQLDSIKKPALAEKEKVIKNLGASSRGM